MLTLIQCLLYGMLPQWHLKDLGHSAESAGERLHLNIYTQLPIFHDARAVLLLGCIIIVIPLNIFIGRINEG